MKRYYMCKKLVDTKIEQTWCVWLSMYPNTGHGSKWDWLYYVKIGDH